MDFDQFLKKLEKIQINEDLECNKKIGLQIDFESQKSIEMKIKSFDLESKLVSESKLEINALIKDYYKYLYKKYKDEGKNDLKHIYYKLKGKYNDENSEFTVNFYNNYIKMIEENEDDNKIDEFLSSYFKKSDDIIKLYNITSFLEYYNKYGNKLVILNESEHMNRLFDCEKYYVYINDSYELDIYVIFGDYKIEILKKLIEEIIFKFAGFHINLYLDEYEDTIEEYINKNKYIDINVYSNTEKNVDENKPKKQKIENVDKNTEETIIKNENIYTKIKELNL